MPTAERATVDEHRAADAADGAGRSDDRCGQVGAEKVDRDTLLPRSGDISDPAVREVLDHLPVAVFRRDLDLRIVWCNRTYREMFGVAGDCCLDWFDYLDPEDRTDVLDDARAVLANDKPSDNLVRVTVPGREPFWVQVRRAPLRDAAGELLGVVGIIADVTDSVRAQRLTREIELRDAFGGRQFTVWILDERAVIREISSGTDDLTVRPPEWFAGRRALDIIHRDDGPAFGGFFERVLATPHELLRARFRGYHPDDGRVIWREVLMRNLLDDPRVDGILCFSAPLDDPPSAPLALLDGRGDPLGTGLPDLAPAERALLEALARGVGLRVAAAIIGVEPATAATIVHALVPVLGARERAVLLGSLRGGERS